MKRPFPFALVAGALLCGCTLAPSYKRPALPVPGAFADAPATAQGVSAADLPWRDVVVEPRLQRLVALALRENRDLRVAVADIQRARALYRIQRAELLPAIDAVGQGVRSRTPPSISTTGAPVHTEQYSASLGLAAFEIDLFGRVRSLSASALQSFFAVEQNRRAVQISLVAEVASAYATLAADQDQLAVIHDTLAAREAATRLTRSRFDAGASSELDLRQAETLMEQARSDAAAAAAQVAQDRNALQLLVGAPIPAELLPDGKVADLKIVADLPSGLPSDVLLRRPDVLAAEHVLKARNADIGAARAAFFPRITLTGDTGSASGDLDGLFKAGTHAWSFSPQIVLPIFNGGANLANLSGARASRDAAVASYEKSIQVAFREVSDALAVRATIQDQVQAQERLTAQASDVQRLTQARYDRGVDGYLALLDAQRSLYAAQRGLVQTRLAEILNRIELYRALGGGGAPEA
jgi:multidrug efflux system outer membrane protein